MSGGAAETLAVLSRQARAWGVQVRDWARSAAGREVLVAAGLAVTVLISYAPTLRVMAERWWYDPQYSHGFLVPVFAGVILWYRRPLLANVRIMHSWWGLPLLALGFVLRFAGAAMKIEAADAFSLLPTVGGLVLLLGGWPAWRWSWPAIAFLGFMLPLPFRLEAALAQPLRRLATEASTYVLQTLGFPALAEGNIIHIDDLRLGVVDACSGLGMLVTFFALATATAMIVRAPWLDRLILIASAIPVALVANVSRIVAAAVAHNLLGEAAGKAVMHDLAGLLMMPLALGLLWLELRLLSRLLLPASTAALQPLPVLDRRHLSVVSCPRPVVASHQLSTDH